MLKNADSNQLTLTIKLLRNTMGSSLYLLAVTNRPCNG